MKELKIEIPEGYEIDKENSTFEKIVFKPLEEDEYPKTWEKCIEKLNNIIPKYYWLDNCSNISNINTPIYPKCEHYNLLSSEKDAEKFLILQKLYTCRKAYIEDWKPDWTDDDTPKYVIRLSEIELEIATYYFDSRSFSFPTLEMAKEFLNNFESDLEFVKDLL